LKPAWAEPNVASDPVFRAGDLVVCPSQRSVRRDGQELPLGKLTYNLLLLLVEASPGIVTHQEINEKLWAGRVVSDDTVRQRIKLLRKALGDDPQDPRYLHVVRGQGIKLIPPVKQIRDPARASVPRVVRNAASVAAIAIVVALTASFWATPTTEQPEPGSIAVLPFEALSASPDDAHFVDGFHNDLLTALAGIRDLKVISRTSVVDYRDSPKSIRDIGQELDVTAILEGSIQRSGNKVRINAQLIDARSDRHLWAQVYDREVTAQNLFDIQAELATAITGALQVALTSQEKTRIRAIPTAKTRAYNQYLLGLHYQQGPPVTADYERAVDAFQQAVAEDPGFALAWAALAKAHSTLYFFSDHSDGRREQAKTAVERALGLAPELAEAHLALGFYRYHAERDYEGALAAWEVAERGMPGDQRLYHARATVYARMGKSRQAVENWQRAVELDPRDEGNLLNLAWQYAALGEYEKAQSMLERVVALVPDQRVGYLRLAYLPLWRDGDGPALRAALRAAPIPVRAFPMEWLAAIYERDFGAALTLLDEWSGDGIDTPLDFRPKSWFYGTTLKLAGDMQAAEKHFRHAEAQMEVLLDKSPKDLRLQVTLADIKANLGDRNAAIAMASSVIQSSRESLDASRGPGFQLSAIKVFLAAGEYETALQELDSYLSAPSVWSIEGLLPDPRFDPIRDDPRFTSLIDSRARS